MCVIQTGLCNLLNTPVPRPVSDGFGIRADKLSAPLRWPPGARSKGVTAHPSFVRILILSILGLVALQGIAIAQPPSPAGSRTTGDYLPPLFATLHDGTKVPVTRPPSEAALQSLRPPNPPLPPDTEPPPPASVDLTANQTAIKTQGGRDTCGTFGTTAALEAAYKRAFQVDLDLSEQYLNHWGQIMAGAGSGTALPGSENNAGAIGGGGLARPLAVLRRGVGVPTEAQLPYRQDSAYQDPNLGDQPDVMNWGVPHTQREIDDFNLAATPGAYIFNPPTVETATIMPQAAIEGARYRVTSAQLMGADQLHDLNVWRRILASHREIILEFHCCDGAPGFNNSTNDVWTLPPGSNGGGGGHVVLVVGYDDARQMFRIKNSWGPTWADHGYAWMSYQFVTGLPVYNAAWIDAVVAVQQPAPSDVWEDKQLWLGRWNFDFDGTKGLLDIDNLPSGNETARLGTLFLDDGRIFRVNGTQNGNLLTASLNWNRWDLPPTETGLTQFSLYLFSWDHTGFAGFQNESGNTRPVQGLKFGTISGSPAPGQLNPGSWFGVWDTTIDGRRGVLDVKAVNYDTGALSATYTPDGGTPLAVHGKIFPDPRAMSMTIEFPTPQSFSGRLNGQEWGVMSGTTMWGNLTFGWMATRRVGAGLPPPATGCQEDCAEARDDCMRDLRGGTPQLCLMQYRACVSRCGRL